jgi:UDP-2-acetamido-3-amino-2,3-dideoxy-glucuronate N-acetyltransferase
MLLTSHRQLNRPLSGRITSDEIGMQHQPGDVPACTADRQDPGGDTLQHDGNGQGAASGTRVQPTADVDERAELGDGTLIWHLAQVREDARIGRGCIIGRGAYVGPGVILGDNVKLQNYALVYEPARLEDGVFIGPAAVLTNDMYPRSVGVTGQLKRPADWHADGVVVREGASVGARAVILAGVEIGRWALIAAGAVVTRDVPDFGLVAGCPARRIGWVGRAGVTLAPDGDSRWRCPETGELFTETDGTLAMTDDHAAQNRR